MSSYTAMDAAVCGSCAHFRLHYIKVGYRFFPLAYGHCIHPRSRKKCRDHLACPHWTAISLPSQKQG